MVGFILINLIAANRCGYGIISRSIHVAFLSGLTNGCPHASFPILYGQSSLIQPAVIRLRSYTAAYRIWAHAEKPLLCFILGDIALCCPGPIAAALVLLGQQLDGKGVPPTDLSLYRFISCFKESPFSSSPLSMTAARFSSC